MDLKLRGGTREDAAACGPICYEAFKSIANRHNFPPDFPSPEVATALLTQMLSNSGFYSVVAELEGRVVGSNFLDERSMIAGVGPITVDPQFQDRSVGRHLMIDVIKRAAQPRFAGVRLHQSGYHTRSFSLYAKLGFDPQDTLAIMQGQPIKTAIPGCEVRAATEADLKTCNQLCFRVHGHDRAGEVRDALAARTITLVERAGRVTGYTTGIAFFGHAVSETNDDLKALIAYAPAYLGLGFLVPVRNAELLRWCLESGLRVVFMMTLMTIGLYKQPDGAWMPSVLY